MSRPRFPAHLKGTRVPVEYVPAYPADLRDHEGRPRMMALDLRPRRHSPVMFEGLALSPFEQRYVLRSPSPRRSRSPPRSPGHHLARQYADSHRARSPLRTPSPRLPSRSRSRSPSPRRTPRRADGR